MAEETLLDASQDTSTTGASGQGQDGSLLDQGGHAGTTGDGQQGDISQQGAADGDQDGKSADGGKQDGGGKKEQAGAPETYEAFTMPEGMQMNDELLAEAVPVFKELNLTQDSAQKLVDLYAKHFAVQHEAVMQGYQETVNGWKKETLAALGNNTQRELAAANKALNSMGTPELRQLLNQTGLANHKDVVTFLAKVGKAFGEDTFAEGGAATRRKSDAEVFYPNMK